MDSKPSIDRAPGPLTNQVVVVTGAARGIGRAIAIELAEAGGAVAVVDVDPEGARETHQSIVRAGGQASVFPCDVTRPTDVDETMAAVRASLGTIDVLVNNAGGSRSVGPVTESDPDEWWSDVELNLRSAHLCSRAILPTMIERRAGRIVNVASNGAVGAWPLLSAYAAAKAGLVSFTSSLAAEIEPYGVRVFAMHPGHVHTELVDHLARRMAPYGRGGGPREQMTTPDAAARLALVLATGGADHLNGHFFADAADNARRVGWRSVARLGMIRRDLTALRLLRPRHGRSASARSAGLRAVLSIPRTLRGLFAALMLGLPSPEVGLAAVRIC